MPVTKTTRLVILVALTALEPGNVARVLVASSTICVSDECDGQVRH